MSGGGNALAVVDAEVKQLAGERWPLNAKQDAKLRARESDLRNARAAIGELVEAAGGGLGDLLAMMAAADRGEVWVVNAGTRLRVERLQAALSRFQGGA